MGDHARNGQALSACQRYRTLLAVSAAIIAHRDKGALFHELADRLHQVVRFDYLACMLHDATQGTMRLHVLETTEPISIQAVPPHVEDDPAWVVAGPKGAAVRLGMKRSTLQKKMTKLGITRPE